MKKRMFRGIRTKLTAAIAISAVTAAVLAFILYKLAYSLRRKPFFHDLFLTLRDSFGVEVLAGITVILLFISVFFILTRRSIRYVEELSSVLKEIEKGNLSVRADVRSNDELGGLAVSINSMAEKLGESIEGEKQAERAKNELITSVSHDLRTPLTSIIGFLGLMGDRGKYSDEELVKFTEIAHKKSLRLKTLIDELFEFTRVSYGGTAVNVCKISIGELVEQLAEEFYPVFQEASMECRVSIPEERILIMADGDLIARLMENLINNAIRYGKDGKYIDIMIEKQGDKALIKVTNYGEPIPKGELPLIFDRFYRVEKSRSHLTGGTGLGLAIVKNIVGLHKGSITVDSGSGGTCFSILLKLA